MYSLEKTRKIKIIVFILSVVSFIVGIIGYMGGGYEIIEHGFMNEPLPSIIMVVAFFMFIVLLILGCCLNAIEFDLQYHLKFLNEKMNEKAKDN